MSARRARSRLGRASGAGAAALALALLFAACGRHAAAPTQPPAGPQPPGVLTVSPPPRAVGVPYDSLRIWAEFAEPLDSSSVSSTTVFVKIDTQRMPIQAAWNAALRRVEIQMLSPALLQQTYTVVLSPNLRSAQGVPFGRAWSWQFTVNGVRRPRSGYPDGQVESPFAALSWTGNSVSDGAALYSVCLGTDSAAVATRTAPQIYWGSATRVVPRARFAQPGPVYWAVTTVSPVTGECLLGPVWRFTTDPPDTPVDSIDVPIDFTAYGYSYYTVCKGPSIFVGPDYNAGIAWLSSMLPTTLHLDRAVLTVSALPGNESALTSSATTLWYVTAAWACTRTRQNGPPSTDEGRGLVAAAHLDVPGVARFECDTLTAYLESTIRTGGVLGFIPRSNRTFELASQSDPALKPKLVIRYYRPKAAAPARGGLARR